MAVTKNFTIGPGSWTRIASGHGDGSIVKVDGLYESLGFNEATIRRNYYPTSGRRENAIIMALPLS